MREKCRKNFLIPPEPLLAHLSIVRRCGSLYWLNFVVYYLFLSTPLHMCIASDFNGDGLPTMGMGV